MTYVLAAGSAVLALAWLPLAWRFLRGWQQRRNPVSLAICATLCLSAYIHVLIGLVLVRGTTMQFLTVASHVFEVIVLGNFYIAFKWSELRFQDTRGPRAAYSVPPVNTTSTPRGS